MIVFGTDFCLKRMIIVFRIAVERKYIEEDNMTWRLCQPPTQPKCFGIKIIYQHASSTSSIMFVYDSRSSHHIILTRVKLSMELSGLTRERL